MPRQDCTISPQPYETTFDCDAYSTTKVASENRAPNHVESLAIALPHEEDPDHGDDFNEVRDHIQSPITSIDEIEKLTGTDMFSGLDDTKEAAVEAFEADDLWPLQGN